MTASLLSCHLGQEAYIASADRRGAPHLAVGRLEACDDDGVEVSGWFCPQTLANLEVNPRVSITVRGADEGFQILGKVVNKTVDAVMDGFTRDEELDIPRVRYRLTVRAEETMEMGDRPHSDRALP